MVTDSYGKIKEVWVKMAKKAIVGFADTIRRLVQVPKAEVDAEEAKYQAMRDRRKAKRAAHGKKPPKGG
jgi:hypothetical protein